jgi:hypothetical protein
VSEPPGWTLVVLAAGLAERYGAPKQLETVGPSGETLADYAVWDALACRAGSVVFVTRSKLEPAFALVGERWAGRVEVTFATQRIDDLPEGFTVPAERSRPWGTAHALLAAAAVLDRPFAVLNADDFYGRVAIDAVGSWLRRADPAGPAVALPAYRLGDTLSPHGGVSRAILRVDENGRVDSVEEVTGLVATETGVAGETPAGRVQLAGDTPVSMNLWACTPPVLGLLREEFRAFLVRDAGSPAAEFALPTAVQGLLARGVPAQVVAGGGDWFGMTHPQDRAPVAEALRARVARGDYPPDLFASPGSG